MVYAAIDYSKNQTVLLNDLLDYNEIIKVVNNDNNK
jgi:hypothetical protein